MCLTIFTLTLLSNSSNIYSLSTICPLLKSICSFFYKPPNPFNAPCMHGVGRSTGLSTSFVRKTKAPIPNSQQLSVAPQLQTGSSPSSLCAAALPGWVLCRRCKFMRRAMSKRHRLTSVFPDLLLLQSVQSFLCDVF